MALEVKQPTQAREPFKGGRTLDPLVRHVGAVLGGAGSETSEWIDCTTIPYLVGGCISDVDGTLYLDFSVDGSTVYHTESAAITGGAATADSGLKFCVTGRFARARYVNGAGAQSSFTLALYGSNN